MHLTSRPGQYTTISLLFLANLLCWTEPASAQHSKSDQTAPASSTTAKDRYQESESESFWMEQKLRLSQEILAGLASGDFDQIGRSAEVMRGLSKVEAFVRREPKGYRDYMRQFTLANDDLVRSAAEENLAGATLAFNQLTISCVNCHRHLREAEK